MEPIRQTLEAIDELDPVLDDGSLLDHLHRMAERARAVVPALVGISIASHDHGVTFTMVATDEEIAALDGVQYLAHGPCLEAFDTGQGLSVTEQDLMDERRWQAFAVATSAAGIRSTLTYPVLQRGEVVGTVNLYGATDDAFDGKHEELAAALGTWAPGAVANADLTFSTRAVAEEAPGVLRNEALVDTAAGIVAADQGLTVEDAYERLRDASRRAGIPLAKIARTIVQLHEDESA